ncbi:MAG TPA: hypothetical protein VFE64_04155 [Devosia sp.]|jgi:hypothetical protein|nr:hypothetical protein [Devosia sp.]
MFKLALAVLLLAGALTASPSFAAKANSGPGCTLNPFTHTMRCVKF